jgi:uncharacterized protein (TIGR02598 family)
LHCKYEVATVDPNIQTIISIPFGMKSHHLSQTARKSLQAISGFSLVEVMIAVGIVASVMLGLVGVMPVGLRAIQDAQHNSVKSRIVQEIISDIQAADWASAAESAAAGKLRGDFLQLQDDLLGRQNIRYYNAQGSRVLPQQTRAGNEPPQPIVYAALAEVTPGTGDNPLLMTSDVNNAYKFLKIVNIFVEHTPGGRAPTFSPTGRPRFVERFPFILSNMGNSASVRNAD